MHHNVYVQTEQHKKAEPAAPLCPSATDRPSWPVRQASQATKQAAMIQTPGSLAWPAVLFVPRKCSAV